MELDANRWYVRLFFWAVNIWDEFKGGYEVYEVQRRGTNLCFFGRTTFFSAPLVLLLHVALIIAAVLALTVLPVRLFGVWPYILWLIRIALGIAVTVGLIWATKAIVHYRVIAAAAKLPKIKTGPSFWEILWEWLVAQKKKIKICPQITFKNMPMIATPSMRRFVLPKGQLAVAFCVVAFLAVSLWVIQGVVADWTKVGETPCVFESWSLGRNNCVRLNFDCEGKEGWTENPAVIVSYLKKPRPLDGALYASGEVVINLQKQEADKDKDK